MSDMTSLERDSEARNRIVSDIDTNFFVEAGAGSGKTSMLVNRMVAMVEVGKPIEKMCAITFTKAAAGEFYERFQKLLIERSNEDIVWEDKGYAGQLPAPTDETRKNCKKALENIDLCFMGTIDAFCAMVLSEHPSEAGIPSDAKIVSDGEREAFYKQQYVRICAGEFGDELAAMAEDFRAFYTDAEKVFVKGLSVLMDNRNAEFEVGEPEMDLADIDSRFSAEREEIIRVAKLLKASPELIYAGNDKSRALRDKNDDIYKNICRKWSTNFSSVIYALKTLKEGCLIFEAQDHFGPILSGLYVPVEGKNKRLECKVGDETGVFTRLQNLRYSATMKFLLACVPIVEDAMREKGFMTFFDYLYYLKCMLKKDAAENGKLINHIYARHSYFLIDEFQDTNPLQAEIFFYLTSKKPVSQWSRCIPRQGSLFIVGDPKQSIYRFRSADVSSFLKVKKLFRGKSGEVLSLSRNFRSTRVMCDYFNATFTDLMSGEDEYQSKFEKIPLPGHRPDEFSGIYRYVSYTGELSKEHPEEADPVQIANIIERLVDSDNYLIRTGDDKEPRRIRYSDIMVITGAKKNLEPIMLYLNEREIPTKVEGKVPFAENEALREISNIYMAVADGDDDIALYGALTGKVIGFTNEELLVFRSNGGMISLRFNFDEGACDNATALRVAEGIGELRELNREAKRLSPAVLFSKIMDDFRVYESVTVRDLEVVYYTLELLRSAVQTGKVVSLKDGAEYIRELLTDADEERCLSLTENRNAIHMANLHKVKGLEAPVVILAAVLRFNNTPEKRIVHEDDGSNGYLFGLSKKNANGEVRGKYFETSIFGEEEKKEKEAGKAENDRLIYVAATRARNALIVCDSIKPSSKGGESHESAWKPLMKGLPDFLGDASPDDSRSAALGSSPVDSRSAALGDSPVILRSEATKDPTREPTPSTTLYDEAAASCALNDRWAEAATYALKNPSTYKKSRSKLEEEREKKGAYTTTVSKSPELNQFAGVLGTMVHKLMEMLVSSNNRTDSDEMIREIISEYKTPQLEPHEKKVKAALERVSKKIKNGGFAQSNGAPQDILKTLLEADEVYCEVAFCYRSDDREGLQGLHRDDTMISPQNRNSANPSSPESDVCAPHHVAIWNGIMDVVYRTGKKWHIIDYKTNADGSALDAKYAAQLDAYIKAFKATTGKDADAMTYHIDV